MHQQNTIDALKSAARAVPRRVPGAHPSDRNFEQDHASGKALADELTDAGHEDAPFFRNLAHTFSGGTGHYESERGRFLPTLGTMRIVGAPGEIGHRIRLASDVNKRQVAVVDRGPVEHTSGWSSATAITNPLHAAIMDRASLEEWAAHPKVPPTLRAAILNAAEALPEEPTKNARPIGWLKDKVSSWLGRAAPAAAKPEAFETDPTASFAHRNAVAQAIRLLGGKNHTDPAVLDPHVAAVSRIVKEKPDLPMVKAFLDKARVIGGTAGPELTEAVKPLVSAANMLLHVAGKTDRFVRPPTDGKAEAFAPRPSVEHQAAAPEAPIELEQPSTPEPAEDRHTAILRMAKEGHDREAILDHVQTVHGAPNRKAAQASVRAAFNRAIAMRNKGKGGGPTKLAAYSSGAIRPEHVSGRVAAKDAVSGETHGFHGLLNGTALAYHLRDIQREHPTLQGHVETALTGRAFGGGDGDPFTHIGRELKARGHKLADAYNWNQIADGMRRDAQVRAFVKKHVVQTEGLSDLRYWDRVRNQFGRGTHKQAEEFWRRFEREHPGVSREDAIDSIARLGEHELDRQYLSAPDGLKEWRSNMGAAPHSEHLRFQRVEWSKR